MISWKLFTFNEMEAGQLYQILKARQDIFIIEQNCIYPDIDQLDQKSLHLLMYHDSNFAGYLRIVPPGIKFTEVSLGRILVLPSFRGKKYAYLLVEKGKKISRSRFQGAIRIEAQSYLTPFYEKCGFRKDSDIYDMDGIDHLQMICD